MFGLSACSTPPPVEEFSIAWTALQAARASDSQRFAAPYWHEAEEAYRKGETAFKDQSYGKAKTEFLHSKEMSEKAENAARIQKFKSGEVSR